MSRRRCYGLRFHLARWEVSYGYSPDDFVRWPTKAQALAYSEGLQQAGVEHLVFRRGPGLGRGEYYHVPLSDPLHGLKVAS